VADCKLAIWRLAAVFAAATLCGCGLVPEARLKPVVRNPFPQLHRVAVAPFFNLSEEKTVDGRKFAVAYYNELQALQGFEVVPVSVVETAILQHNIDPAALDGKSARRLAQLLDVDAIVIGAITEYSPYYPPRCGLQVEWWAANPCFHPIPPGRGLPWGTSEEEYIPESLVYEAEMALAREQLKTQSPRFEPEPVELPTPPNATDAPNLVPPPKSDSDESLRPPDGGSSLQPIAHHAQDVKPADVPGRTTSSQPANSAQPAKAGGAHRNKVELVEMPDPRGFIPPGPSKTRPRCIRSNRPVLRHTQIFHGNDPEFTAALANYEYFRDDARFGGWQSYLQRSDDFIRFCCHLHISEMLSARGGAGETQLVWRWSTFR